jgi:hypothetical protein
LPGALGPVVSVLGRVFAVTAPLGADALRDGWTATTVKECGVAAASRSTVTARSPRIDEGVSASYAARAADD